MGEARIQYVADAAFCSVVYTGSTWYTFLRIARTYLMEIMGSAYLPPQSSVLLDWFWHSETHFWRRRRRKREEEEEVGRESAEKKGKMFFLLCCNLGYVSPLPLPGENGGRGGTLSAR